MPTPIRTKTRLKAVAAQTVPQTRDEAAQLIGEIGNQILPLGPSATAEPADDIL